MELDISFWGVYLKLQNITQRCVYTGLIVLFSFCHTMLYTNECCNSSSLILLFFFLFSYLFNTTVEEMELGIDSNPRPMLVHVTLTGPRGSHR